MARPPETRHHPFPRRRAGAPAVRYWLRLPVRAVTLAVAVAIGTLTAGPTLADVIVLRSTAPTIAPGRSIADTETVQLAAGQTLVVVLPNGATRTLAGPSTTRTSDLTKGVGTNAALVNTVRRYMQTGQVATQQTTTLRSAAPSPSPRSGAAASGSSTGRDAGMAFGNAPRARRSVTPPPRFAGWERIPIDAEGDYCVSSTARLELFRQASAAAQSITVVDMRTTTRVAVGFKAGAESAPWPARIPIATGGTYAFVGAGAPMHQVRLRRLSPLPSADETLRVLHGQRCLAQLQAWLSGLMTAAR